MNSHDPIPNKFSNRVGWIALGIAAAWFIVHAAIYTVEIVQTDHTLHRYLEHGLKHFFGWQMGVFFGLAIILYTRRPASTGRVLGAYLVGSSVVLLAFSRDIALVARFAVLLLWMACAIESVRQAINWAAGERYATLGVAAAALYAALVPICFFLGVFHAITPPVVTAFAVAFALPGAIGWINRLRKWSNASRSLALHENQGSSQAAGQWSILAWCLIEVIWFVLAIEFIGASTSESMSDSARVHLPYMLQVIADQGLSHQYACWFRLQPMAIQTCGAVIASVGTIAAAKWFSWLALAMLVLLVVEEAYRRSGSLEIGLFAGAAVLSCPVLTWLSKTLYIDHVMTFLCTAAFIVLFRALRPPCFRGILLSAAIVGSMVQVKYPGLVFAVVWALFLTIDLFRKSGWRVAISWSAAAGALAFVAALPWYVYVYLGTGNPFYPYLNSLFHSPYWPDGFMFQKILEENFKLPPGIAGIVLAPWTATYHTTRFVEGYDGILGFWALALVPCLFLAWRRKSIPYGDMAIAGAAMIAGVVSYTPYIRYWLPGYPLLVASCVLAAGSMLRSIQWQPRQRWMLVLSGVAMASLLLLPMPFWCASRPWCASMPWDEYTKKISREEWRKQQFQGYEAVAQLNNILLPSDGVICTYFEGVYLVGGRPYEFAFRWNDIHHIHDLDSFEGFVRRYGIRYWIVNNPSPLPGGVNGSEAIAAKYWTDARLVSTSGTVAVYDLASEYPNRWQIAAKHEWATQLGRCKTPWKPTDVHTHWVNLDDNATVSPAKETIAVAGSSWLVHRIEPEIPGGTCRVNLGIWSNDSTASLMEIAWFDAQGKLLSRTRGAAGGNSDYDAWICAVVPPKATNGWVYLREWKQRPMQLKRGMVTFLKQPAAPTVTRHDKPQDEARGVQ